MPLRVLIGCEVSGVVRRAFRAAHDAWSCDLQPSADGSPFHFEGDLLTVLRMPWDLAVLHPPCEYLTVACNGPMAHGCSLYTAAEGRKLRAAAVDFFLACINAPVARVCVENPIGIMSTRYRKPDQIIQPYQFGHDASKATCLWLRGLPKLTIDPADYVKPRMVCKCGGVYAYERSFEDGCPHCGGEPALARPRWANQTNSGQNKLAPSPTRAAERAVTYSGVAAAMATQWGSLSPIVKPSTKTTP